MARRLTPIAVLVAIALCLAPAASANVSSTEEPNFTRGTSNTWWFNWSDPGASTIYRLCYGLSANGGGSVSQGCTGNLRGGGSGSEKITVAGLQPGSSYVMCATERYDSPGLEAQGDLPHVTDCESTAMDATKPQVGASINGTDETTSDPRLRLHIAYADSQSPPWFYFDAFNFSQTTSVYGCFSVGTTCVPPISDEYLLTGCGVKNNAHSSRFNSMDCTVDWTGADGKIYFCARVADSALADRPGSANQLGGQTPGEANVSDVGNGCGYITLTRASQGTGTGTGTETGTGTGTETRTEGTDGSGDGTGRSGGSALAASAPARVRRGRAVAVRVTAPGPGTAHAMLLRRGKVLGSRRVQVTRPGTVRLKLRVPARAKPGVYRIKLLYFAADRSSRASRTLKLRVLR